jgi:hypothetical protein
MAQGKIDIGIASRAKAVEADLLALILVLVLSRPGC